jgi:thiamine-monophosphate kinase
MMDLSDGLSSDIAKLCEASGVGARVFADKLPISKELHIAAARLDADPVELAASGGGDYELLLTCAADDAGEVIKAIESTGSRAHVIGEIVDGNQAHLVSSDGEERPMPESWSHF